MGDYKVYRQYITISPEDLGPISKDLRALFKERTLLLLEGPVGAGKTELVKFLMKELGIEETASPTFAIHHQYQSEALKIDHVDLYRLESEDDLESTGFWDLFGAEKGVIAVEWSDRLNQGHWPLNWYKIKVEIKKLSHPHEREVVISTQV